MWHWKNNGPRPPWSTEEIIAALGAFMFFYAIVCFGEFYFLQLVTTTMDVLGIPHS